MADKILVLVSNPEATPSLNINREIRVIQDTLYQSSHSNLFKLEPRFYIRNDEIQDIISREKPRIVHFCGHGANEQGLIVENKTGDVHFLNTEAFKDALKLFANQIECVVLNACYSETQAQVIHQHINYVIGTKKEIQDRAAITFSKGFYEALGRGESFERAFEQGRIQIRLEIYGNNETDRKLIPVYSEEEQKIINRPQEEILTILVKDPLNEIEKAEVVIALNNIPYNSSINFVGRDAQLQELNELLKNNQKVAITGMGGVGKTELALQYAFSHQENYPGGVLWLKAREEDLGNQIINLSKIKFPEHLDSLTAKVKYFWHIFRNNKLLIILDDVSNDGKYFRDKINPYLPPVENKFKVLMTSREYLGNNIKELSLWILSSEEAMELLVKLTKEKRQDLQNQKENFFKLAHWLGCLPLALELVSNYLNLHPHCSIKNLLDILANKKLDTEALLDSEQLYKTASLAVASSFELSWKQLEDKTQLISVLLGQIYGYNWQFNWIKQNFILINEDDLHRAISQLYSYGLLRYKFDGSYQVHPLIKYFLISKLRIKDIQNKIQENELLSRIYFMITNNVATYNVVVVGFTGVGKSSLINYLYGEKVAETGIGRPVTRPGFYEYNFSIGNMPVSLFDSEGFEAGNTEKWMNRLDKELTKRGVNKPAEDWFHSVFYCMSAVVRIQDYDYEVIKKFIQAKYKVVIILTQVDLISKKKEDELKHKISSFLKNINKNEPIPIISVCSEEGEDRCGNIIKRFGKDEIQESAYKTFWKSISLRLPSRCRKVVDDYIDEWRDQQKKYIEEKIKKIEEKSFIKNTNSFWDLLSGELSGEFYELNKKIHSNIEKFCDKIINPKGVIPDIIDLEITRTLEIFTGFANHLNYPPKDTNSYNDFNVGKFVIFSYSKGTFLEFWKTATNFEIATQDWNQFIDKIGQELNNLLNSSIETKKNEMIRNLDKAIKEMKRKYLYNLEDIVKNILKDIFKD